MPASLTAPDPTALSRGALAIVTGASGFIGGNLVDALLARGFRVRSLVRDETQPTVLGGAIERMPVRYDDPAALRRAVEGAEYVFHLGGVTKALSLDEFRQGNVRPTAALLEALRGAEGAAAATLRRFVLVSSQAAAGPAPALDRPRREDDAPAPVESYGESKLEAERLVAAETRLPWTIVRPPAVYGPRDRDFLAVFRQARMGMGVYAGSRERWLSMVHVRDLVGALIAAATTPRAAGRVYFCAHPTPVTWHDVYGAAARAAGAELRAELDVPQGVVEAIGWLGDAVARVTGRVGLLNSQKIALGRAEYWVCSAARARAELGWSARVPLEAGMQETFDWYREHGWL